MEPAMASAADWVEDVKRWYFSGQREARPPLPGEPVVDAPPDVGYEAAHPSLQARHWPDAPTGEPASPVRLL
jgi:hypothetical protein